MIKKLWCVLFHWGKEKVVIKYYSNRTCRYYCNKCNHECDN